jgi:NADPH:quinone reductase-like Zn-dependent oxidoreductase
LIGHLATQCAVAQKARVIAVDLRQERLDAALKAGALHALNPDHENIIERVKDLTNDSLDVAVDVTGLANTANQTLKLLPKKPWGTAYQPSGRLLLLGSYTVPVCFTYHGNLFEIEPDILIARDNVHQDYKNVL